MIECWRCGGSVPLKSSSTSGTQSSFCSAECKRGHRLAYLRKWQSKNRDRIRKQRAAIRDRVRLWNREFYARHRDRRKQLRVERYRSNPEKALQAARKYAAAHPDLIRSLGRKSQLQRRARLVRAFVEVVDPAVVFDRDKGICGICSLPVAVQSDWHVDHIVPLAKGGEHSYANVQLAHGACNRSKGAKLPVAPSGVGATT